MTTIYIVTDGDYSDYHIIGMYSTKELAEEAVKYWAAGNEVEEWELDHFPRGRPPGLWHWHVYMFKTGEVFNVRRAACDTKQPASFVGSYFQHFQGSCLFSVWAKGRKARDQDRQREAIAASRRKHMGNPSSLIDRRSARVGGAAINRQGASGDVRTETDVPSHNTTTTAMRTLHVSWHGPRLNARK